ncbi:hypothetical protein K2173_005356 [Erythroxylum novogranatense]|uniref:Uncharacterized protein n=1 Tax=Erythroxylum novogranatense TaxID=1862640 RepID=A0AAV8S6S7_9ROSI|nr:hypothetical protein K2173_005356 [Erythroxylum novogranatense]
MGDNLFEGLPPPSHEQIKHQQQPNQSLEETILMTTTISEVPVAPKPILKSALKRPKLSEYISPNPERGATSEKDTASGKRLRFKTTTDASEAQVIVAMQKIASHIKNPTKFAKACKLTIQLIQAGSVKPGTSDNFIAILEAAMSSTTSCTDPSMRADYRALFSAAQDAAEFLNIKQKHLLAAWTIRAVMGNDLFTDDSFVFSKTAGQVKEAISDLPVATEDDDIEEVAALNDERVSTDKGVTYSDVTADNNKKDESDPFGLDAFIPSTVKKDERAKAKKGTAARIRKDDEEETRRFLKSQREALISCLEIAANRYRTPWCQTTIDILVKHAFDNVSRFTSRQRDAIEKLWASIREQQTRRKQGKSIHGKLDVTAFEWLQEKYAGEKISVRHSVGGSGDRRAQQWLG